MQLRRKKNVEARRRGSDDQSIDFKITFRTGAFSVKILCNVLEFLIVSTDNSSADDHEINSFLL